MKTATVNKSQYGHHEYVYDSSEEDEVASVFDLDFHQRPHLKTRRRIRAETVQSLDPLRGSSSQSDNLQVQCIECDEDPEVALQINREALLWDKHVHEPNMVLVAVEACHISPMDVAIRRGRYQVPTPCVLGSNFVGVVHKTSNEASGWRLGKRVAGLTLSGSNARYLTASTEWLLDVPKKLDASDIACILSIYLPAFQALHHGQPRPERYSQIVLRRKRVLITGGALPEAMAVLRMAHYGGAQEVYVVAERSQHNSLRQLYATPLDVHQDDWGPMVEGSIDVVIDFDYVQNEKAASMALAPKGRLVWYLHPSKRENIIGRSWSFDGIVQRTKMCLLEQASIYDQFESWTEHPYSFKMDLEFLLRLLALRQIRPKIDQFIGLAGVKAAHKDLQTGSLSGAIICEPWKDYETFEALPKTLQESRDEL